MGFKDADWAYTLPIKGSAKAVLVAIAHRTDDRTHRTIVGHETLANMTGLTRGTITSAVGVLRSMTILTTEIRNGAGGYRTSNVTVLNRAYVPVTNVGETNVGGTNVGQTGDQSTNDGSPMYPSDTAEEITQIDHSVGHSVNTPDVRAGLFENAWRHWPRREKKKDALAKFRRLKDPVVVARAIVAHGDAHSQHSQLQYVRHLVTWLNQEGWNDPLPQAQEQSLTRGERNLAYVANLARQENTPKGISA